MLLMSSDGNDSEHGIVPCFHQPERASGLELVELDTKRSSNDESMSQRGYSVAYDKVCSSITVALEIIAR